MLSHEDGAPRGNISFALEYFYCEASCSSFLCVSGACCRLLQEGGVLLLPLSF